MYNTPVNKFITWFNRIDTRLIIFLILCLNKLTFGHLSGGEEHYLQYAKQFYNPDWIPNSFTLTEFASSRIVFQYIWGFLLNIFSFEAVSTGSRIFNFFLFAFPVALIGKHFKLSNVDILIILQYYIINIQGFFAKPWIFKTFEPKTLAYFFVLYSFYFLLRGKYYKSAIFSAIACYFHFLVGGWFFGTAFILMIIQKKKLLEIAKVSLSFLAIALPILSYIAITVLINTPATIDDVNLNNVYCYLRLPHHTGIFKSMDYFKQEHLKNIIITLVFFALSIYLATRKKEQSVKTINTINLIFFTLAFLFVVVAYIDHQFFNNSGGFLLKTYPFRQMALAKFFVLIIIIVMLNKYLTPKKWYPHVKNAFFLIMLITLFISTYNTSKYINPKYKVNQHYEELTDYIKNNTQSTDIFVLIKLKPEHIQRFTRKTDRENFFVFKFVAAGTDKLYEWYKRYQAVEEIQHSEAKLEKYANEYNFSYLVSNNEMDYTNLELEFSNSTYFLYKIIP